VVDDPVIHILSRPSSGKCSLRHREVRVVLSSQERRFVKLRISQAEKLVGAVHLTRLSVAGTKILAVSTR
jgi:hypothetical protein